MEIIRRRNGMQHARVRGVEEDVKRVEAAVEAARLEYIRQTERLRQRRDALEHEQRRLLGSFATLWADHAEYWRRRAKAVDPDQTITLRMVGWRSTGERVDEPRIVWAKDRYNQLAAQAQAQADQYQSQSNNLTRSGEELQQVVVGLVEPPAVAEEEVAA